jgi:hypothetical protein
LEAKRENTFSIGEEMQRKEKEQRIAKYIHRYQLLWETERTDLRVTEYRYPPFDRGERD